MNERYHRNLHVPYRHYVIQVTLSNPNLSYKDIVSRFDEIDYTCGDQYDVVVSQYQIHLMFNKQAKYLYNAISDVCMDLDDIDLIDYLHEIEVGE